jgi:peptidoglycan/xylan/chitin deacetylase (PgdA/CDA1 family)
LAQYLYDQGIRATFFMAGQDAERFPDLLPRIKDLGHLIANHTYNHPNLTSHIGAGGSVVDQVLRADVLLKNWVDNPITYFRPPYGAWSAEIAAAMNGNLSASLAHVGPVNWNIDGADWFFWNNGDTAEACANSYLTIIREIGQGIILMHDNTADLVAAREGNLTCAMTEIIVPILRAEGYEFIGLDEVDEIRAAAETRLPCALLASNDLYVSPQQGGGGDILVEGPAIGDWETLGVEYLGPGKVALSAANGLYLSPQDGGGGEVLADGPRVGNWEPLNLIPIGDEQVAFRTVTGHFLTRETDGGGRLMATSLAIEDREVFTFQNIALG